MQVGGTLEKLLFECTHLEHSSKVVKMNASSKMNACSVQD